MAEQTMIHVGEKTAAQVLEASRMIQQARGVIETIAATLREVHGVPESWQLAQGADGNLYLQETDATAHTLEEHMQTEGQTEGQAEEQTEEHAPGDKHEPINEHAPRDKHTGEQTDSTA